MLGFRLSWLLPFFIRRRLKGGVARSAAAAGCCRPSRRHRIASPAGDAVAADQYSWCKEGVYWHVVAGGQGRHVDIDEELLPSSPRKKIDSYDGSVIFPPLNTRRRGADHRRPRRREPRKRPSRLRLSRINSSPDGNDDTDSGWSTVDDETEMLISTTEFDSSAGGGDGRRRRRSIRKSMSMAEGAAEVRRLVPCVSTVAVRESFAVVKRSQDPRADFRQSMAEMAVEKEILDPPELEQLLRCYLSLNSRRHHAAIFAAFSDIWDALFPEAAGRGRWLF